jgi:hypothetical protein
MALKEWIQIAEFLRLDWMHDELFSITSTASKLVTLINNYAQD